MSSTNATGARAFDAEVIIIGGGPVGMGLSIELGQRGIGCIVIERYPQPQPIPKGQNLTQRTMEHFHFWGAEKALRAARTIPPEYGIGGLTAYGTLLGKYHHDWLQRSLVQPYYFQRNERLPQYASEAVLRQRAAELPNVETLYGDSFKSLTDDGEGVTVEIAKRDGSEPRTLRSRYVVGSDGSRSLVRQAADITQTLSEHDRLMALVVFRSTGLHDLLAGYPGKSYYNVLQPELQGYWKFFGRVDLGSQWFFHAPVPQETTRDNFDFKAYLHEAVGAEFDIEFDHIGFWDLRFAIADHYRAGRVFIAGDAAHSHPPYGGYGVNSGLEDARNLGWKLAAELQGWAGADLLDSYEAERHPVFASTVNDFIAKAIDTDREFMNAYDPAVDRAAFEREWAARGSGAVAEVNSFEPNYEGSPIVAGALREDRLGGSAVGSHRFEARAGHHLSPARTESGRDVFELLGSGFTVLAFDVDPKLLAPFIESTTLSSMPIEFVHLQAGGETARYQARLVLVRPDHFVAWASNDAADIDGLGQALRRAVGS